MISIVSCWKLSFLFTFIYSHFTNTGWGKCRFTVMSTGNTEFTLYYYLLIIVLFSIWTSKPTFAPPCIYAALTLDQVLYSSLVDNPLHIMSSKKINEKEDKVSFSVASDVDNVPQNIYMYVYNNFSLCLYILNTYFKYWL